DQNSGQGRPGMLINRFAVRCFGRAILQKARFLQNWLVLWGKHQIIYPLEEICARFVPHALRKSSPERILFEKSTDPLAQQRFRLVRQGPVKSPWLARCLSRP